MISAEKVPSSQGWNRRSDLRLLHILLFAWLGMSSCTSAEPQDEPRPAQSTEGTTEPTVAPIDPKSAFAIWPEDTANQALAAAADSTAGDQPWRRSATGTALRFARQVFGWRNPSVEKSRRLSGLTEVQLGDRRGGSARVQLGDPIAPNWWSVLDVQSFARWDPTLSVRGRRVMVSFGNRGQVVTVVQITFGDMEVSKTVKGSDASLRLPDAPKTSGAILLLLQDESGYVFDARGVTLPAGDYAAG
jgi:hypothetical protein